jgi:glycosyltransferase involved in cell wall biosynthesis
MGKNISIGLMNSENTILRSGPKVFMDRLTKEINSFGLLNQNEFDIWLNLSFKKIPNFVLKKTPIVTRFDGIWKLKILSSKSPVLNLLAERINALADDYVNKILKTNFLLSNGIIYQSNFSKRMVEAHISNSQKDSTIIYNGVDIKKFFPNSSNNITKRINILVSHKLWPIKRFDQIPKIIKVLLSRHVDVHVNVLGDGVINPLFFFENSLIRFRKEVAKLGLEDNFTFHGHIDPELLPSFYRSNDLMLNLSFADPCPNVVIEAMASGLPVIAPNHGGIPELVCISDLLIKENINEENFFSFYDYSNFPSIDPIEYADRIIFAKDNNSFLKNTMRDIAVSKFNIDNVAAKYINFLNTVFLSYQRQNKN